MTVGSNTAELWIVQVPVKKAFGLLQIIAPAGLMSSVIQIIFSISHSDRFSPAASLRDSELECISCIQNLIFGKMQNFFEKFAAGGFSSENCEN